MQAEHLPDLHRGTLHLAERSGDAGSVPNHVLGFLQPLGRAVAEQAGRLAADHGNADTSNQSAHPREPAQRGGRQSVTAHEETSLPSAKRSRRNRAMPSSSWCPMTAVAADFILSFALFGA